MDVSERIEERPTVARHAPRRRWLPFDPLVPAVAVVAGTTYALHGFDGMLTRDLAIYSYAGQQVAEGVPPYLGVMNRAGPLAHAIPALGVLVARGLGLDDLYTMRIFFMLIAVACVCAVYLLGRDAFRSRLVGVVTASTFLTFSGFIHYASNGPREKTPMTLFIVLALWSVVHRRWLTAGVFVSLATLCLQIAFFASFAAVVAGVVLLAGGARIRSLLRVALGGAVPVAVLAVWFALAGSLRASIDAFVLINYRYTTPDPLLPMLEQKWEALQVAYDFSVWLLVGGVAVLLLHGVWQIFRWVVRRGARVEETATLMTAFAVGAGAGLAWNIKEYDAWPDLFPLLPLAALGIGLLFAFVRPLLATPVAVGTVVVLALLATALSVEEAWSTREHRLVQQRESVERVLDAVPGATITSVEGPQPLVLAQLRNPTRHQMFRSGLQDYLDDEWPGGLDGFRRDIVERGTTLVTLGDPVSDRWRAAVEPEYVYIGSAPDFFWYARADLGAETIARLREAAGYDPDDEWARPPPAEPTG